MKILIIQTSPFHTASTFLVNAIYGMIPELSSKKIIGTWSRNFENYFAKENIICLKCHNTNLDALSKLYCRYKVLFVCSERQELDLKIEEKYKKKYGNAVVFEFQELNETIDNPICKIVDNIHYKFQKLLTDQSITEVTLDKATCIERINSMNARYEEIKSKPFSYVDDFFEIHGSHRNRRA
jgi:hypothetical protein